MVDRTGFEPVTSSMPWRRATNYANGPVQVPKLPDIELVPIQTLSNIKASLRRKTRLNARGNVGIGMNEQCILNTVRTEFENRI